MYGEVIKLFVFVMSTNDLGDEMRTLLGSFFAVVIREELFMRRRDTFANLKVELFVLKRAQADNQWSILVLKIWQPTDQESQQLFYSYSQKVKLFMYQKLYYCFQNYKHAKGFCLLILTKYFVFNALFG